MLLLLMLLMLRQVLLCIVFMMQVELHLTACGPESYNCHDGTCVTISKRCDKRNDCPDASDEKNCKLLVTSSSYQAHVAPNTPQHNEKNRIEIHIIILKILNTKVVENKIKVQFSLSMSWYDSRLMFKNLKAREYYNVLNPKTTELWIPSLGFHNTEDRQSTVSDSNSSITVFKEGNLTLSGLGSLENAEVYRGEDNKIRITRNYDINFICNYHLFWFPFDVQTCFMNISIEDQNFLQLVHTGPVTWLGERKAEEYIFLGTTVTNETFFDGLVGICVEIKFEREIIGAIMTIYIPSTLIVFVSYLTTIFNNKQWFGHIITINLTVEQ